jgi:hypothetical protein
VAVAWRDARYEIGTLAQHQPGDIVLSVFGTTAQTETKPETLLKSLQFFRSNEFPEAPTCNEIFYLFN